jgi:hypothetical protein
MKTALEEFTNPATEPARTARITLTAMAKNPFTNRHFQARP